MVSMYSLEGPLYLELLDSQQATRGLNGKVNNPRRKPGRERGNKTPSSWSHGQLKKERQRNEIFWITA